MAGSKTVLLVFVVMATIAGCGREGGEAALPGKEAEFRWCDSLPREVNRQFQRVDVDSDWFEVRRLEEGVFAILEPNQFQETISYLVTGSERATLFDTGLGMSPLRPVVEQLTSLPVSVLNSHTHYDHVGGNADFERILAFDSPYTRANQAGFPHSELSGEVAPESFCQAPPAGLDPLSFHTRAWKPTGLVADGDKLDLGGRTLEVLHVPGHTPDALALIDRANGLLWTGDTYYDATLWLYVPETDLDAYERSLERLVGLAPSVKRLLPAHNTVSAEPARLAEALRAIRQVRSGGVQAMEESNDRVIFRFPHFSILTSKQLLEGGMGDPSVGGSGLSLWR